MLDYDAILRQNSVLEGERIILRPFILHDVNDVFSWASDERVTKYLTWPPHADLAETEKIVKEVFLNRVFRSIRSPNTLHADRAIRLNPITDYGLIRSRNSVHGDHL